MLQLIEFLDLDRVALAVQRDDDGEADGDLGRGDGEDEEHEDVAVERAVELREGDQRERRRQQHQLEAHVDHERVLAQQHAEEADGEQQRADEEVGRQAVDGSGGEKRDHLASSVSVYFLLSTMTPSMAMSSMKPTT